MNIMVLPDRRATVMLSNKLLTHSNTDLIEALTDTRKPKALLSASRTSWELSMFLKKARGNGSRFIKTSPPSILSLA